MAHNTCATLEPACNSMRPDNEGNQQNHELQFVYRDRQVEHTDIVAEDECDRTEGEAKGKRRALGASTTNPLTPAGKILEVMHLIEKCKADQSQDDRIQTIVNLRRVVHELEVCSDLSRSLIESSKILETGGLRDIFDDLAYPEDVRVDSYSLCMKWGSGQFDNDLLCGINIMLKVDGQLQRSLAEGYRHQVCAYRGQGRFEVGQWWPYQICSLRDGGHGSMNGGVYGQVGNGVYLILLGSGRHCKEFKDVDDGDRIAYCGKLGKDGALSGSTKLLLESYDKKHEIRVLESSGPRSSLNPIFAARREGFVMTVFTELSRLRFIRKPVGCRCSPSSVWKGSCSSDGAETNSALH